jgi:hypothetical protein
MPLRDSSARQGERSHGRRVDRRTAARRFRLETLRMLIEARLYPLNLDVLAGRLMLAGVVDPPSPRTIIPG